MLVPLLTLNHGSVGAFAPLSSLVTSHAVIPPIHNGDGGKCTLCAKKSSLGRMSKSWLPRKDIDVDDIFAVDEERDDLERRSIEFVGGLLRQRLRAVRDSEREDSGEDSDAAFERLLHADHRAYKYVKGRFMDLTCTLGGEIIVENLFANSDTEGVEEDVISGAVVALQSLLVMGTQFGMKGSPDQLKKFVSHLKSDINAYHVSSSQEKWDRKCTHRLKHDLDTAAGTQLLAELKRKRTPQGAFDLLVNIGAWSKHEDLALLRSGFPTKFTEEEEEAAKNAQSNKKDPDTILGIRKDFRRMKVYTIDGAFTADIDDGLSVEVLTNDDGSVRNRFWIHIADADQWAPRDSDIFAVARERGTSVYLPTGSVPMFPTSIGTGSMSLRQGCDCYALSLGLELLPDGSIDTTSIVVTPSLVRVSYRLTYDEVDEMLEEGVGFSEEWQLGAMLAAAKKRRGLRVSNGSSEGMVPTPIPQGSVSAIYDAGAEDKVSISVEVEVPQNAGTNQTSTAAVTSTSADSYHAPASEAFLLVTEMMIMAGEAIGKWGQLLSSTEHFTVGSQSQLRNTLELPYRCQTGPDFSRVSETKTLEDLRSTNAGGGYCQAWYYRRFFKPVRIIEEFDGHAGLGLDCYVQWSSPIRRFGDLQVHAAVKRFIRRKKVNELLQAGSPIPPGLSFSDLGCTIPDSTDGSGEEDGDGGISNDSNESELEKINFRDALSMIGAARQLQRKSQEYWMLEYIRRLVENSSEEVAFECVVLGCVDPNRGRYAIYVHELGLEQKYNSEVGELGPGRTLWLRVAMVNPRIGLLTFTLASKTSGMAQTPRSRL